MWFKDVKMTHEIVLLSGGENTTSVDWGQTKSPTLTHRA